MNSEIWICQSFWTRPMINNNDYSNVLKVNLQIAALSLLYAHNSGYKVRMHTDSIGYQYLKEFGYDDIKLTLDKIPDNANTILFAQPKFYTLLEEGIGIIHIDFDVFLKKRINEIDNFYNNQNIDVIYQCIENNIQCIYTNELELFKNNQYLCKYIKDFDESFAINVGTIGFNDKDLFNKYINNYFNVLQDIQKYNIELKSCPDLILEQLTLYNYIINKKAEKLLPDMNICDYEDISKYADKIGYQHLQGPYKHTDKGKTFIDAYLYKFNKKLYSIINNFKLD